MGGGGAASSQAQRRQVLSEKSLQISLSIRPHMRAFRRPLSAACIPRAAAALPPPRTNPLLIMSAARLSTASRSPLTVLNLQTGATKEMIKKSFYELAKQVHPDVAGGGSASSISFVELLAAYETLMAEHEGSSTSSSARTAPNKAARSSASSAKRSSVRRPTQTRAKWRVGDILCEQLLDADCTAETIDAIWADVKQLHLSEAHPVSEFMLDAIFGACARAGGGLDQALALYADGKLDGGLLSSSTTQTAAVCNMMKWHGDEERMADFAFAVSLVDEWIRTPDDFERLQSAYYVHFGEDPLCVGYWRA